MHAMIFMSALSPIRREIPSTEKSCLATIYTLAGSVIARTARLLASAVTLLIIGYPLMLAFNYSLAISLSLWRPISA